MSAKRFRCACLDAETGMEFEFDLDSTSKRAAIQEADRKYNGVLVVYQIPERTQGLPPPATNDTLHP